MTVDTGDRFTIDGSRHLRRCRGYQQRYGHPSGRLATILWRRCRADRRARRRARWCRRDRPDPAKSVGRRQERDPAGFGGQSGRRSSCRRGGPECRGGDQRRR